jgi:hypothetical protein
MKDLGVQMDFAKSGQQISIVFIARDQEGRICTPNIPEWEWLPQALSLPPYRLQGISCHVISPEQLLSEKEGYQQGTGQPLRPKDLQSMATLRHLIQRQQQVTQKLVLSSANNTVKE